MQRSKNSRKVAFALGGVVLLTVGAGTAGWFYRGWRLAEIPAPPARARQTIRPIARIALDSQTGQAAAASTPSVTWPAEQTSSRSRFEMSFDPMEGFQEDLRNALLHDLTPAFSELPKFLGDPASKNPDPAYPRFAFQLVDAAENGPADQRPAKMVAADLVASAISCRVENKEQCNQLRNEFAQHKMTLEYSELDGGFYYQRDLLWRVWQQYPETEWGQEAFVLLLERGWDTSSTCARGSEQFREVIRQGESFLQQRPTSPQRAAVLFMLGQAYATWWSLSNETADSGMADYVDPKQYKDGAEPARVKAIGNFEQVGQLAPDTKFAEYARQILLPLRDHKILNNYKFFCVYD